jgi:Integrase core domain
VERAEPIRFLIHGRDSKFTAGFDEVFRSGGIRTIRTAVRAPRANAFIERSIGTLRRECLDRILIMNRRHLDRVLRVYIRHYSAPRRARRPYPRVQGRSVRTTDRVSGTLTIARTRLGHGLLALRVGRVAARLVALPDVAGIRSTARGLGGVVRRTLRFERTLFAGEPETRQMEVGSPAFGGRPAGAGRRASVAGAVRRR